MLSYFSYLFHQVTRIMGTDANDPYDIVGANHNMSTDNIKKRYALLLRELSIKYKKFSST